MVKGTCTLVRGAGSRAGRDCGRANDKPLCVRCSQIISPELSIGVIAVERLLPLQRLIEQARDLLPDEPMIVSLEGVLYALMGQKGEAIDCVTRACSNPKTFGHAHHTYYQIACTLALTGRRQPAFEWLERSVGTGFACWPFFMKDPCLQNLRGTSEFELLVSTLQAKYPDNLGVL